MGPPLRAKLQGSPTSGAMQANVQPFLRIKHTKLWGGDRELAFPSKQPGAQEKKQREPVWVGEPSEPHATYSRGQGQHALSPEIGYSMAGDIKITLWMCIHIG